MCRGQNMCFFLIADGQRSVCIIYIYYILDWIRCYSILDEIRLRYVI